MLKDIFKISTVYLFEFALASEKNDTTLYQLNDLNHAMTSGFADALKSAQNDIMGEHDSISDEFWVIH
jgi:hypothetical protein